MIVVAVRDSAMDAFMQPFFVPTTNMALRSFKDEVNRADANNPLNKHPEDYDLYQIAEFNDETGQFSNNTPERLVRAKDVKEEK